MAGVGGLALADSGPGGAVPAAAVSSAPLPSDAVRAEVVHDAHFSVAAGLAPIRLPAPRKAVRHRAAPPRLVSRPAAAPAVVQRAPAPVAAPPVAAPAPTVTVAAGPNGTPLGVFVVTCYDLSGTTASGAPAGPGTVAVDPSVIPLGTRIYVAGAGSFVAEDTGGAIVGRRLDIWEPSYGQCAAWGVQSRQVWIQ